MLRAHVLIIRRSKLRYTASGIITPVGGRLVQVWWYQRLCNTILTSWWYKHMCSKHIEAWNKLIVKQKCCASSWLITEINLLSWVWELKLFWTSGYNSVQFWWWWVALGMIHFTDDANHIMYKIKISTLHIKGKIILHSQAEKYSQTYLLMISNFHRVLNVVCFLLGNSLASEFYMLTFWSTLSLPSS